MKKRLITIAGLLGVMSYGLINSNNNYEKYSMLYDNGIRLHADVKDFRTPRDPDKTFYRTIFTKEYGKPLINSLLVPSEANELEYIQAYVMNQVPIIDKTDSTKTIYVVETAKVDFIGAKNLDDVLNIIKTKGFPELRDGDFDYNKTSGIKYKPNKDSLQKQIINSLQNHYIMVSNSN